MYAFTSCGIVMAEKETDPGGNHVPPDYYFVRCIFGSIRRNKELYHSINERVQKNTDRAWLASFGAIIICISTAIFLYICPYSPCRHYTLIKYSTLVVCLLSLAVLCVSFIFKRHTGTYVSNTELCVYSDSHIYYGPDLIYVLGIVIGIIGGLLFLFVVRHHKWAAFKSFPILLSSLLLVVILLTIAYTFIGAKGGDLLGMR